MSEPRGFDLISDCCRSVAFGYQDADAAAGYAGRSAASVTEWSRIDCLVDGGIGLFSVWYDTRILSTAAATAFGHRNRYHSKRAAAFPRADFGLREIQFLVHLMAFPLAFAYSHIVMSFADVTITASAPTCAASF